MMTEAQLLSRMGLAGFELAVEAVVEFLAANGHHDAARELGNRFEEWREDVLCN